MPSHALSRRQFLRATGIALASMRLGRLEIPPVLSPAPSFEPLYGRALATVFIHAAPSPDSPVVARLWSDAVAPIHATSGSWYCLPQGYAPRELVQPLLAPTRHDSAPAAPPFWGEVSGTVAVVRTSCSATAPIITRVGHGGVLRVVDYLPTAGDSIDWYGVAVDEFGALLGWVLASVIAPTQVDEAAPTLSLLVETAEQRLTVRDHDTMLLTAPLSTALSLTPGIYPIAERHPVASPVTEHHGAPWALTFGGQALSGAYWHNRFGTPPDQAVSDAAVQVAPALAKWLYPRAAEVIIS